MFWTVALNWAMTRWSVYTIRPFHYTVNELDLVLDSNERERSQRKWTQVRMHIPKEGHRGTLVRGRAVLLDRVKRGRPPMTKEADVASEMVRALSTIV
jgi:hypothetical protein